MPKGSSLSSEIIRRLSTDPWTHNGLLVLKECQPWQIRLGSLEVGAVGPGGSGAAQPERKPRAGQAARADSRLNGQRGPAKGRLQAKK
jgi:hypothetical protein